MYSNHQGKYDALGIMSAHQAPCTVMIDDKRSHQLITTQFISLLKGIRLDKTDMKKQVKTILDAIRQVKEGRRIIIFPEGGYYRNRNEVHDFLPVSVLIERIGTPKLCAKGRYFRKKAQKIETALHRCKAAPICFR